MIEWKIMSGVPGIRYTNTLDHTHATWENGVVTFHSHNHGNGQYISKDGNKICMQSEHFILLNVKCSDATEEFKELHKERISIRICIRRLLRTQNNSHTKDEL